MVCQLRPFVYSLGLNNPPRICLTPRKSRVKNLLCNKQGNCRCKMAGAGIWSFAKFCGQMPRMATTWITSWQTALKWTVDCQVPRSGFRGQVKPVAIRVLNATHLSAELSKKLNSCSRHFTSRAPLFEASYLFTARLLEYKIPTRRIVYF
jgi:hypothetical protein